MHTLGRVDSGAGLSCISSQFVNRLRLKPTPFSRSGEQRLSTADGYPLKLSGTVDLTLTIQGLKVPQKFYVVDNLNYNLILGLDFMANTKAYIDFGKNTLSICDDLVVEHLVPQKLPGNTIRVISNCTIPPSSEAIIPVISDRTPNGQLLLQPLPFLCR